MSLGLAGFADGFETDFVDVLLVCGWKTRIACTLYTSRQTLFFLGVGCGAFLEEDHV